MRALFLCVRRLLSAPAPALTRLVITELLLVFLLLFLGL
jgi:hypothetical protein